jgi:PAS domain-containing protein
MNRRSVIERIVAERTEALRKALGNLQGRETRYRKLLDLLPYAIIEGRKNAIVLANKAAIELTGVSSASELVGRRIADFVSIGKLDLCGNPISRAAEEFERLKGALAQDGWVQLGG